MDRIGPDVRLVEQAVPALSHLVPRLMQRRQVARRGPFFCHSGRPTPQTSFLVAMPSVFRREPRSETRPAGGQAYPSQSTTPRASLESRGGEDTDII